jgi:hypothetical protein
MNDNKNDSFCVVCRLLFLFIVIFSFSYYVPVAYSLTANNEILLTMRIKQRPLHEVLDLVAEQTGYTVKIEEKFADKLVSGDFVSISVDTLFQRILKGENKIIVISPDERSIVVKTVGQKKNVHFVTSHSGGKTRILSDLGLRELNNDFPVKKATNNMHIIDHLTGKSWEEEDRIMDEFTQRILAQKWSSSPESEHLGLTELNNDFPVKKAKNNMHVIDHLSGKTWQAEDKIMAAYTQKILKQQWSSSIESANLGLHELLPIRQQNSIDY